MRRPKQSTIAAGLILALVVAAGAWYVLRPNLQPVAPLFGGPEGLATVTNAEKVDAYRLERGPGSPHGGFLGEVEDYRATAGPVPVPPEVAARLAASFASSRSYQWDSIKACLPIYGVKLSFYRGDHRVDVYLCMQCDTFEAIYDGQVAGGEDFDRIRPVIVRALKQLFPDDAAITALKE